MYSYTYMDSDSSSDSELVSLSSSDDFNQFLEDVANCMVRYHETIVIIVGAIWCKIMVELCDFG